MNQDTTTNQEPVLRSSTLHKHYRMGGQDLHILRGIDMEVRQSEFVAIYGRSGSGKSTLLHLLGGLDRPNEGEVFFNGDPVFRLRGGKLDRYRNQHVGFVFQQYHLLPELNAFENVLIGSMVGKSLLSWAGKRQAVKERAKMLLEEVGLSDRMKHRPSKLSGGERQRVAIARALINEPDVLMADEPTGNLDIDTSGSIIELFQSLHQGGQTLILVTHDEGIAKIADRSLTLVKGKLE
ncbi:P-loop containing nucleoside triphosphate hydrolase [Poriferisphaera corsica]|uniref:P-loop containing nucleoside triphosphate hydrolase n=1 Tax=Poriferisphaera corsica TaxID=2528020 RepID=A0A517YQX6_9BACT|nr:ABC transporter ATP-binding protein [Poriferisphaera corsica]QDU32614.1 P-loop containing nucleoside triphosphate hydrolase [Poriferisphaera corsica]